VIIFWEFFMRRKAILSSRLRPVFVTMPLLLMLANCAQQPNALQMLPNPQVASYHLGAGDQVRVITYDETQLSNDFTVGADGTIAFPLLGTLQASGLTVTQLETRIAAALQQQKLLSEPSVSVQITQYRPISVLGEVNRPGQYPYQPGMTMLDAVALAGGFTYRAVTDAASDWRSSGDPSGQSVQGQITPGSNLAPGDVITIAERYF
jgi:polysaccharide export outer membrane protein